MLFQPSHISDGIGGCDDPERGRNERKEHTQGINPEFYGNPGKHFHQGINELGPSQDGRDHGGDDAKFYETGQKGR